ncbi:MAG: mechanosensitive ion channel protein MscS [Cardiobacteriales bacterium]|nr:MAG: mechanosensitive ion channel protein MscS [Cardiobacteriales bacterium]
MFYRWLIIIILIISGFSQAQQAPNISIGEEEVSEPEQAIAVSPLAKDNEIQSRISEIMAATGWYKQINVKVDDGIVFLDGLTDSDEHRQWARNLASKTQDVVAVVNRIKIDGTPNWNLRPALIEIQHLLYKFIAALPIIVLTIIVLPLAWFIAKYIYRLFHHIFSRQLASGLLADIMAKAVAIPTFLLGVYIVLQVAGLTNIAVSIIGGAGILGIVIGFAFRDIAENFLASLLLSLRHPFTSGDLIAVADQLGIVQSMNTRNTVLLSNEGNLIQIPNSIVFKNIITNYTASSSQRETIELGIGYDASISDTQTLIMSVLLEHSAILQEPKPLVLVDSLGAATVNMKIYYWFNGHSFAKAKVRSAILRLLKRRLMEEGVTMPDDAREVIFPDGVPVLFASEITSMSTHQPVTTTDDNQIQQPATEVDIQVTDSEGNLTNERQELEAAAESQRTDDSDNLLKD